MLPDLFNNKVVLYNPLNDNAPGHGLFMAYLMISFHKERVVPLIKKTRLLLLFLLMG